MNDTLLQERISILKPAYLEFVTGQAITETVLLLAKEEGLDEEQTVLFKNGVGLYLLCFFDEEETIDFIATQAELPRTIASPLFGAVFSTLPPEIVSAQQQAYIELTVGESNVPNQSQTKATTPIPPPSPETDSPEPIVGYAAAAKQEVVHQSSQDTILRPPQPPTPPQDETAHRDTHV